MRGTPSRSFILRYSNSTPTRTRTDRTTFPPEACATLSINTTDDRLSHRCTENALYASRGLRHLVVPLVRESVSFNSGTIHLFPSNLDMNEEDQPPMPPVTWRLDHASPESNTSRSISVTVSWSDHTVGKMTLAQHPSPKSSNASFSFFFSHKLSCTYLHKN